MLSLWDYAVKVYGLPGVKDALLKLQDRYHLDVNAVLWGLWCARYGFALDEDQAEAVLTTTKDFALHTTRPLRAVRLFLSAPKVGFSAEDLKTLRDDVLQIEVKSEELVLKRLDAVTTSLVEASGSPDAFRERSAFFFTLARENVDTPIMIADEEGPESPGGLFNALRQVIEDYGP
ncbi:MAG: TIGR02444 family protein [Pseudomonadota bacterium]